MDGIHSTPPGLPAATAKTPRPAASPPPAASSGGRPEAAGERLGDRRVRTDIDSETGRVVGVFLDKRTGEVIDQVPSEAMLRLLAKTRAMLGALFDEKA